MTNRPVFGRINQNSADKVHKPTIQKSKIIKKWFFQTIDAGGASWWILAQKRPTTPKVLIFVSKNSSDEKLIQRQYFWKIDFFVFFSNLTSHVKLFSEELNVRTATWKFSQRILGLFRCILHHKRIYNDIQIKKYILSKYVHFPWELSRKIHSWKIQWN